MSDGNEEVWTMTLALRLIAAEGVRRNEKMEISEMPLILG